MRKLLVILGAVFILVGCSPKNGPSKEELGNLQRYTDLKRNAYVEGQISKYNKAYLEVRESNGFYYKETWQTHSGKDEPLLYEAYQEVAYNGISDYDKTQFYFDAVYEEGESSRRTNAFKDDLGYERMNGEAYYHGIINMEELRDGIIGFKEYTFESDFMVNKFEQKHVEIIREEGYSEIRLLEENGTPYFIGRVDDSGRLLYIESRYIHEKNQKYIIYCLDIYDYGETIELPEFDFSEFQER